jgi:glutamine amidotransferase
MSEGTSSPRVLLLDYGAGNLRSVRRALERAGAVVEVTSQPPSPHNDVRLVVPGVGAFGEARRRLVPVWDDLVAWVRADKPTLGVCLGMQLLFESSEEHGHHEGLGVIPGDVVALDAENHDVTVPNMGWHRLNGEGDPAVYFAHSFGARPGPFTTATVERGGAWSAVVKKGRVTGYQSHPEKSGDDGIAMLRAWLSS